MPTFPYAFPFVFGAQEATSETLSVTATFGANASVTKQLESALSVSASTSSSGRYDAIGSASNAATASTSSSLGRVTYGDVTYSVTSTTGSDSSETGYAATECPFTASPSAVASRGQSVAAQLGSLISSSGTAFKESLIWSSTTGTFTSTGIYGEPVAQVPPKIYTFFDNFVTRDETRWAGWGTGIDVVDGKLNISLADSPSIYTIGYVETGAWTLDLYGSKVLAHLISPPNVDNGTPSTWMSIEAKYSSIDSSNKSAVLVKWLNGNWRFSQIDADGVESSATSVSYDSGSWVRVRLESGIVYWDVSADGLIWTNEKSQAVTGVGYQSSLIRFSGSPGSGTNPGVAQWDQLNSPPRAIQAEFSALAEFDNSASRGQLIQSSLSADANFSGIGRYDAAAQAAFTIDPYLIGQVMRTQYLTSTLSIDAELDSIGTEFGVADAEQQFVFDASGTPVVNYAGLSYLGVAALLSSVASRGQSIHSDIPVTVTFDAAGQATYRASAHLAAYLFISADSLRDARAGAQLAVEFSSTGEAVEYGIADAEFSIGATTSASMSRGQSLVGDTQIGISSLGFAVTNQPISFTSQFVALGWATIEEPISITVVPVDNRTASVAAVERDSSVLPDNRQCAVPVAFVNRSSATAFV